jgi:ribosome-associated toxin RatA of RatAB toxin-antitoxin module
MSELSYNYKMTLNYSFEEIWEVIKNPNNYVKFIKSCESLELLEEKNKNDNFYYKAKLKISTPIKYIYFDSILEKKSKNEIILYNLKNDYIDNLYFSWKLKRKKNKTEITLNFKLLFYSYTIQYISIYNRENIINDLIKSFINIIYKECGKRKKSLYITFKEIIY